MLHFQYPIALIFKLTYVPTIFATSRWKGRRSKYKHELDKKYKCPSVDNFGTICLFVMGSRNKPFLIMYGYVCLVLAMFNPYAYLLYFSFL